MQDFIDGECRGATERRTLEVVNPSTGEVHAEAPLSTGSSSSRPSSPVWNRATRCSSHEIFDPVITVQRFDDEDKALAWAKYGLASSVWTTDHGRAMRMAKALDEYTGIKHVMSNVEV